MSLTAVHNLPRGSRGKGEAFEASRAGASAHYALLRYALKAQQAPAVRLAGARRLRRPVRRGDALVAGEQFGIGGQDSVRGFDERELIDDRGNRANLELQTPDFGEHLGGGVFARALVFLDHGWLHRNQRCPGKRPAVTSPVPGWACA